MNLREALQRLPRPSPRRAAAPQPASARRDRAAAGDARRLPHRLSQPRRGDPHHPRGGRPQGRDDAAFEAHRRAGRGDPQHAAARLAQARGDRDQQGARGARPPSARSSKALLEGRGPAAGRRSPGDRASCRRRSARETRSARRRTELADAPAPIEIPIAALVEREPVTVLCSEKGWIRAHEGPPQPAAAELKFKEGDGARFVLHGADHRPAAAVRAPTAASTRSAPTSCRAGAAMASRCG